MTLIRYVPGMWPMARAGAPRNWQMLVFSLALPFLAAVIGSWLTFRSLSTWYPELAKPWFSPPDWVFGPVWTLLYLLMGIALYRVLRHDWDNVQVRYAVYAFGIQLVLNVLWSGAFFALQSPLAGVIVITLLWMAIVETVRRFNRVDRTAALLLGPYLLWVTYAAALNVAIWLLS